MSKTSVNQLIDPWQIIETDFCMENSKFSESIFSQANEFIDIKGNL